MGGSVDRDAESPDKQQVRLTAILKALQKTGSVSVEGLSKELDVSLVTIRRDLDTLEGQGLPRRTHGGAVSIEPAPPCGRRSQPCPSRVAQTRRIVTSETSTS